MVENENVDHCDESNHEWIYKYLPFVIVTGA